MVVRSMRLACVVAALATAVAAGLPVAHAAAPPTVSVADVTVSEGEHGRVKLTFTVELSEPASRPVHVGFATADGSATAGSDYTARRGHLVVPPRHTQRTVHVLVAGDTAPEPDEHLTLTLTGARHASIADGTGVGTIRTDDLPASLTATVDDRGWCDPNEHVYGCYLVTVAGSGLLPSSTVTVYRLLNWVDGTTWLTEVTYPVDEDGTFVHMTDRGFPGEFVRCTASPDDDGHMDAAWATGTTAAGEPIQSNVLSGSQLPC